MDNAREVAMPKMSCCHREVAKPPPGAVLEATPDEFSWRPRVNPGSGSPSAAAQRSTNHRLAYGRQLHKPKKKRELNHLYYCTKTVLYSRVLCSTGVYILEVDSDVSCDITMSMGAL